MMSRLVFERVRPLGWAGALARGLAEAADRVRPGYPTDDPYVCGAGHVTTRLSQRQAVAAWEARRLPRCRARGCGRPMLRCPIPAEVEGTVRRALGAEAADLYPADRLEAIRLATTNGATRARGGAAHDDAREQTS